MHRGGCGVCAKPISYALTHNNQGNDHRGALKLPSISVGSLQQGHHETRGSIAIASSGSGSARALWTFSEPRALWTFSEPIESERLQDHGGDAYLVEEAVRG